MNFDNLVTTKMLQCVECHADEEMMKKYNILTIDKAHDWLPNLATHYKTVRCVDCHSVYEPPHLSHNILTPEQTIRRCEECHSKNSVLMGYKRKTHTIPLTACASDTMRRKITETSKTFS